MLRVDALRFNRVGEIAELDLLNKVGEQQDSFTHHTRTILKKDEPHLDEWVIVDGNVALNGGIDELWTLFAGGSATPFDHDNAYIGVGDGSAAADPTQDALQGTNQSFKGMNAGYPTYGSNQKWVGEASWGSDEGNFTWNEWGVANGDNPPTSGVLFNRKVESLGTKTTGTWTLRVELAGS